METVFLVIALVLFWGIRQGKKESRVKAKSLDVEYQQLVKTHIKVYENGSAIKKYLLQVLEDWQNDQEKFSEQALKSAAQLYDEIGPAGYYWITEIAAQFVLLSAAKMNEIPTSVDLNLKPPVTPAQLVEEVVRVNL